MFRLQLALSAHSVNVCKMCFCVSLGFQAQSQWCVFIGLEAGWEVSTAVTASFLRGVSVCCWVSAVLPSPGVLGRKPGRAAGVRCGWLPPELLALICISRSCQSQQ